MEKKYIPLAEFFQKCDESSITLTFEALENIMGQALPNAAYLNASWWKKTKPPLTHYLSWIEADFNVIDVKLGRSITFSKSQLNIGDETNGTKSAKQTFIVRQVESDDARSYINLLNAIYAEDNFEYYSEVGCNLTVQQVRKTLLEMRKQKNSMYFVCIMNGEFAGYAAVHGHTEDRKRHVVDIRLGVLQAFQHVGIGSTLIKHIEAWARENKISRLQADILQHNEAALALFKKAQFVEEGTLLQSFKLNEQYFNETAFSKIL